MAKVEMNLSDIFIHDDIAMSYITLCFSMENNVKNFFFKVKTRDPERKRAALVCALIGRGGTFGVTSIHSRHKTRTLKFALLGRFSLYPNAYGAYRVNRVKRVSKPNSAFSNDTFDFCRHFKFTYSKTMNIKEYHQTQCIVQKSIINGKTVEIDTLRGYESRWRDVNNLAIFDFSTLFTFTQGHSFIYWYLIGIQYFDVGNDKIKYQMEDNIIAPSDAVSLSAASEQKQELKETHVSIPVDNSYQIKPSLEAKFKEIPVKEIIRNVLSNLLTGKTYEPEYVKRWTIAIANEVNDKVKDLEMKRYKHIVQVILGEKKGAGVKSGVRCLWDSDVDSFTSEIFMSDTIFCLTTVFAVFVY